MKRTKQKHFGHIGCAEKIRFGTKKISRNPKYPKAKWSVTEAFVKFCRNICIKF